MSLGVFKFGLSVTTKQRRAAIRAEDSRYFDFLCTEAGEPLLAENGDHLGLEQFIPVLLVDDNGNIILTESGDAIDIRL